MRFMCKKGKGYAIANTAHNGPVPDFVYHSARNMNAKPATFRPNNGRLAFVRTRPSRRAHTRKLQNNAGTFCVREVCARARHWRRDKKQRRTTTTATATTHPNQSTAVSPARSAAALFRVCVHTKMYSGCGAQVFQCRASRHTETSHIGWTQPSDIVFVQYAHMNIWLE